MFALKRCEAAAPVSSRGIRICDFDVVGVIGVVRHDAGRVDSVLEKSDRVRGLRCHVKKCCEPRGAASGALRVSGLGEREKVSADSNAVERNKEAHLRETTHTR